MVAPIPSIIGLDATGGISGVNTSDKTSMVKAINENVSRLNNIAIDVTTHGAIGDGITDDTTAIQNIINSVISGMILFPPNKTFETSMLTVSNPNVILIILGIIKTDGITITGAHSGAIGYGIGTIDNKLKYASVATQVAQGATQITLTSNPFSVGDSVQSSYGLGGDGGNPIQITAINGNTITIASATSAIIPVGANIGTYQWSAILGLKGIGSFCDGINFQNARGYSFYAGNSSTRIADISFKNCIFDKNGLDTGEAVNCDNLIFDNCKYLYNIDCAKQGLVVTESTIKFFRTIFNRKNSDVDIYITGANTLTELEFFDCRFIGSGNTHPAPYNNNSWNPVQLNPNANSTVDKVKFHDCYIQDYLNGLVSVISGNTNAMTVNTIKVYNTHLVNAEIGSLSNVTISDYSYENCEFDGKLLKTSDSWFLANNVNLIELKNCLIKNDNSMKVFQNVTLINCKIANCNNLFQTTSSFIKDLMLVNTSFMTYPSYDNNASGGHCENLIISNPSFVAQSYVDNVVNLQKNNSVITFSLLNGHLGGWIYRYNYHSYYTLKLTIFNGNPSGGLINDDWYIPNGSIVEDLNKTGANRFTQTTKCNATTTTGSVNSGTNIISVSSVGTMAIGDYINILQSDGRVLTSKITSISGTTITFSDNLFVNVANGANVCAYLY